MEFDSIPSSVLAEILAALIIGLLSIAGRKIFIYIQKGMTRFSVRGRKSILLSIADHQIKEFVGSKIVLPKEKENALDFLKNDLKNQLNKIELEESQLHTQNNLRSFRVWFYLIVIIVLSLLQIVKWQFELQYIEVFSYLIIGSLLIYEIAVFIKWQSIWIKLSRKRNTIFKEVNRALFILGPKININFSEFFAKIYDKEPTKKPLVIQKELQSLGFDIDRSEIMRVTLSYRMRNENETARRKIVADILKTGSSDPQKYDAIPDDERRRIELTFANDYIDSPDIEIRIIRL